MRRKYSLILRETKSWLSVTLVALGLSLLDPFGVGSVLRQASQEFFYTVIAENFRQESHGKQITVVLQTDEDLRQLNQPWPIRHDVQAELLIELASARPSAIFIDYLLIDKRVPQESEYLFQALSEISEFVPIVLVSPFSHQQIFFPACAPESCSSLASRNSIYLADARLGKIVSNITSMPIAVKEAENRRLGPALSMLQLACDKTGGDGVCSVSEKEMHGSVELVWPSYPSNCPEIRCQAEPRSILQRSIQKLLSDTFPAVFSNMSLSIYDRYPYRTLSAVQAFRVNSEIREELEGDFVFLGGAFAGVDDSVMANIYGRVPGVYAHAALLDNLLTYNNPYSDQLPFGLSEFLFDVLFIVMLTTAAFSIRLIKVIRSVRNNVWSIGAWPDYLSLIGFSILYNFFEVTVIRTSPEHWFLAPSLVGFGYFAIRLSKK